MFAGAFSSGFARGAAVPAVAGFAGAFSGAFAGVGSVAPVAGYICPMKAQAALAGGAGWSLAGHGVRIGGALLIGQAGKVFAFVSPESAAAWVEGARAVGLREAALIASIDPATAGAWKEKKRVKLAVIAGHVVNAAARQADAARRAALLAEADYALSKWAA